MLKIQIGRANLANSVIFRFDPLVASIGPLQAYTTRLADNLSLMVAVIVVLFWNFFANRHWTYNDVE